MADVFDVKPGDRVRIVLEGTVWNVVAYQGHERAEILLDPDEEYGLPTAGVWWKRGQFATELVVFENEEKESK